jgi:hypothetical protein
MGRPGAGANSLWPVRACSCVYGILRSCPPLPDNQASPRVCKGGGLGVDSTRTPLTRIRTSMRAQKYLADREAESTYNSVRQTTGVRVTLWCQIPDRNVVPDRCSGQSRRKTLIGMCSRFGRGRASRAPLGSHVQRVSLSCVSVAFVDSALYLSGRKKARMSCASSSGSSIAAKWPPRGSSVQRCRL